MKVAVTGSIGSGKSTVSRILASRLSARYVDTDHLCRLELEPGTTGYNQFLQHTGTRFLQRDGMLDRDALRQAVFGDADIKTLLESILHPLVQRRVACIFEECGRQGCSLVVEVPLLYEVGWQDQFDDHLLVYVPEKEIYARVFKRSRLDREVIARILSAQMSMTQKRQLANHVVDNSELYVSVVQQLGWIAKKMGNR